MAIVVTTPSAWIFACDPIIFKVTGLTGISNIWARVYDKTGVTTLFLAKYSVFNNECTVDLSGYIKNLFASFQPINYSNIQEISDTYKDLLITFDDGVPSVQYYSEHHNLIYGVSQVLGNQISKYVGNVGITANKWLTGFTKPKYWKGYPLTLSYIRSIESNNLNVINIYGSGDVNVSGTLTEKNVIHANIGSLINSLTLYNSISNTFRVFENIDEEFLLAENIVVYNINSFILDTVYLRWLNELGGYDYYMFYIKDVKEATKSVIINKYPSTLQAVSGAHPGTAKTISKNNNEIWVVGADDVLIEEYNELRKISRSPKVDMWISSTSTWLGVIVADTVHTIPKDIVSTDIELNLIMPEIFTQR